MSIALRMFGTAHEGRPGRLRAWMLLRVLFLTLLFTGPELLAQGLEEKVEYSARDSTRYMLRERVVVMYGAAKVKYQDIELTADRIVLDMLNEEVCAYGVQDSTGTTTGKPKMVQSGHNVEADSICYNFKTKKGYVRAVRTAESQMYVLAGISKVHPNKETHSKGGMITTCDRPEPHYHFAVNRMMVIPDDKIITGAAYLKIGKIPTPLAVPFGLFPNQKGGASGVLIPTWGNSPELGYFLLNGGYYFPIGERFDQHITGDIYTRGSWGLRSRTRYKSRYRYGGEVDLQYNVRNSSIRAYPDFAQQTNFFVRWNHTMDPKASLNSRFNASVNLGTSQNFTNTFNSSMGDYLTNTFNSTVSYNRTWSGKPYSLGIAARHSQNSLNRTFDITLPSATFNVQRFFPTTWFGGVRAGRSPWYDRVGLTWSTQFDNQLRTTEDQLYLENLQRLTRDVRNGVRNTGSISTSFKTRWFTLNPQMNFSSRTYFDKLEKQYDPGTGTIRTDTLPGLSTILDHSVSVNMTSKVYGMYSFRGNGRLRAIRHVITPTAGLSYVPGNDQRRSIAGDDGTTTTYDPYQLGIYGSTSPNASGLLNLGLIQSLEGKMRERKADGSGKFQEKKLKLVDYFGVQANYDMLKDSVRWSPVSMAARTQLFNLLDLNLTSSWDPYSTDANGRQTATSALAAHGRLANMRNMTAALGFALSSNAHGKSRKERDDNTPVVGEADPSKGADTDFSMPWQVRFHYSYGVQRVWRGAQYTEQANHSLLMNGDITLFKYWKLGASTGYDIAVRDWTPTSLNLYWDLHCWEFNLNVVPMGIRKSFSVRINVKASVLRDLKYELRKPYGRGRELLY